MNKKISYSFVIADLFHFGHLRVLKEAKKSSDYHICGVLTDLVCEQWAGKNLCELHERKKVIESCKYVDEVMIQSSINPIENLKKVLKKYKNCKITVFHGDDWPILPGKNFMEENNIKTKFLNYYDRLSINSIYHHFSKNRFSIKKNIKEYRLDNRFNLLGTKAKTLKNLNKILKKSIVEPLYIFKVREFLNNRSRVINSIKNRFNDRVIIRSSTSKEDKFDSSNAGEFLTLQNISINASTNLINSILSIIKVYKTKISKYLDEEILVQQQSQDIKISGVSFTKNLQTNAPYYTITYDDQTGFTDTVTSGKSSNTIWLHRSLKTSKYPKKWRSLISSIKEIESIFKSMVLDIEFAIRKDNKILIYQVRPLAANIKYAFSENITQNDRLEKVISDYKELKKIGTNILSDMTFWNPSELIGSKPKPLSYSFFNSIFMEKNWNEGLLEWGYTKVNGPLMCRLGNKPYIDVKKVIAALLPNQLDNKLRKKLQKFYEKRFIKNPESHDKFEFEIMPSSYLFENQWDDILSKTLKKEELRSYKDSLIKITKKMINNFKIIEPQYKNSVKKCIKESFNDYDDDHTLLINKILENTMYLKKYATTQFSSSARLAFISKSILESLMHAEYISDADISKFYKSLNTVTSDFAKDINLLNSNQMKEKYGHLRSGTYSISAPRLDKLTIRKKGKLKFKKTHFNVNDFKKSLERALKESKISCSVEKFYTFLRNSIKLREYLKFEYTKVISNTLEMIIYLGQLLNIPKSDIEFLDIKVLNSGKNFLNKTECRDFFITHINSSKDEYEDYNKLLQNQIVTKINDFYFIEHSTSRPNFVTKNIVEGRLIKLDEKNSNNTNLDNKIILIESADPGYDWIFSYNLKGLITKYGGVGSHMAIRCAEFNLAAAIGCGDKIFNNINKLNSIILDCLNERINQPNS